MIRVFFLLLLLAFGSVTKTFNTYPPNQRNIINRINTMVQPEMTDEKSGPENLTKQHCEYVFQSIDIQENIFKEGGLSARLEHPFLDLAEGIVPGISYSVHFEETDNSAMSNRPTLVLLKSKPSGFFIEIPPWAIPCGDVNVTDAINGSATAVLFHYIPGRTLQWISSTTTSEIEISFQAVYQGRDSSWRESLTSVSQRKECFIYLSSQFGTISLKQLKSYLLRCFELKILLFASENQNIHLKFLGVSTGPEGSVAVVTDHEGSHKQLIGYVPFNYSTSYEMPVFISQGRFLLLEFNSCLECNVSAAFYSLDQIEGCNETWNQPSGTIKTAIFSKDCFYYITAPHGYRILLTLAQYGEISEDVSENCTKGFLKIFGTPSNRIFQFCETLSSSEKYQTLMSKNHSILIHLNYNSFTDAGFIINYTTVPVCIHSTILDRNGYLCGKNILPIFHKLNNCLFIFNVFPRYQIEINFPLVELFRDDRNVFGCIENFIEVLTEKTLMRICINTTNETNSLILHSVHDWIVLNVYFKTYSLLATRAEGFCIKYKSTPIPESSEMCQYPWISRAQYCYKLFEQPKTWENARSFCLDKGGQLVTIPDYETQIIIEELIKFNSSTTIHALWIGASDIEYENYYVWTNGQPFEYTNWFPGWPQYNHYSAQPSDDGLEDQDCIELRDIYRFPSKGKGQTEMYYWNDRNCEALSPFICQRSLVEAAFENFTPPDCNRYIFLWSEHPQDFIESPGYPNSYSTAQTCYFNITAPQEKKVEVRFNDFLLEEDDRCSYDYVEIQEGEKQNQNSLTRHCGNWTDKLKLLRFLSRTNQIRLKFHSDISNSGRGFQAEVRLGPEENEAVASQCDSQMFRLLNNTCYLLISYPEVKWSKANDICIESGAILAIAPSLQQKMILQSLVESVDEARSNVLYWVGGVKEAGLKNWYWIDGQPIDELIIQLKKYKSRYQVKTSNCLGIRREKRGNGSHHYWLSETCNTPGKFICMKNATTVQRHQNITSTGTQGIISSPNFPSQYFNNFHYIYTIVGPPFSRIYVTLRHLDLELQEQCLYDYVSLRSDIESPERKFCGRHRTDLSRFDFISSNSIAVLTFHSDYAVSGSGFEAAWKAIDVSICQKRQKINVENKNNIFSPHYPLGLLSNIHCQTRLETNLKRQILLTFNDFDVGERNNKGLCENDYLHVLLDEKEPRKSVVLCGNLTRIYRGFLLLSYRNTVTMDLKTFEHRKGKSHGFNVTYELWNGELLESIVILNEEDSGTLTSINFPHTPPEGVNYTKSLLAPLHFKILAIFNIAVWREGICEKKVMTIDGIEGGRHYIEELCSINKSKDETTMLELLSFSNKLQFTIFDPGNRDDDPFVFSVDYKVVSGASLLNDSAIKVRIMTSYDRCRCENSGTCEHVVNEDGYQCRCTEGFTGRHCDQYLFQIRYKPLSERMLEEPFWLGLITMSVVLLIILLVYCVKRKFADKIERFLAEEIEKSKNNPSTSAACYGLNPSQGNLSQNYVYTENHPNSFFNRLRTHSFCASFDNVLHSPSNGSQGHSFNFDDLLKRSHSIKKVHSDKLSHDEDKNNKEASEILASLINKHFKPRRMSLDDFIKTSSKLKLSWMSDNPKSMSTTSEEMADEYLSNQLAPQFSCYSAPSFTEFNQSMDEQSFEQETSENPQCKVIIEEGNRNINSSAIQKFGELMRKTITEQATFDSVEDPLQQKLNISTHSQPFSENVSEIVHNFIEKQSPSNVRHSDASEISKQLSLPSSPNNIRLPSNTSSQRRAMLKRLGQFFYKKSSAEFSPPKILITSSIRSYDLDDVNPEYSYQPLTVDGRTVSEINLSTSGCNSQTNSSLSRSNSYNAVRKEKNFRNGKLNQLNKSSPKFLQVPNAMDNLLFSQRPKSVGSSAAGSQAIVGSNKKSFFSSKTTFAREEMEQTINLEIGSNSKCPVALPRDKAEDKRKSREAFNKLVAACSSNANDKINLYNIKQISAPIMSSHSTQEPFCKEEKTYNIPQTNISLVLRNPNKATSLDSALTTKTLRYAEEKLEKQVKLLKKENVSNTKLNKLASSDTFKQLRELVDKENVSKTQNKQHFANYHLKEKSHLNPRSSSMSDLPLSVNNRFNVDRTEQLTCLSLESIVSKNMLLDKRESFQNSLVNNVIVPRTSLKLQSKLKTPTEYIGSGYINTKQNPTSTVLHNYKVIADGQKTRQLGQFPSNQRTVERAGYFDNAQGIQYESEATPLYQRYHPNLQRQVALHEVDNCNALRLQSSLLLRKADISLSKPVQLLTIPQLSIDDSSQIDVLSKESVQINKSPSISLEDKTYFSVNVDATTGMPVQQPENCKTCSNKSCHDAKIPEVFTNKSTPLTRQINVFSKESSQLQNKSDEISNLSNPDTDSPRLSQKLLMSSGETIQQLMYSELSSNSDRLASEYDKTHCKSPKLLRIPRISFDKTNQELKLPEIRSNESVQWFEMTECTNQKNNENV